MNPRITRKELALLIGAIRRVFSRSQLRQYIVEQTRIKHHDPERPRVTRWSHCKGCNRPKPTYTMQVDHISPVIPVDQGSSTLEVGLIVDRIWCEPSNLQALCEECHSQKTKVERTLRTESRRKQR